MGEILRILKPVIDREMENLAEDLFYDIDKKNKETFTSYVTTRITKKKELCKMFSPISQVCHGCQKQNIRPADIPDEIWSTLLMKGARLNEEQRENVFRWEPSNRLTSEQIGNLLGRLDSHFLNSGQNSAAKSFPSTIDNKTDLDNAGADGVDGDEDDARKKNIDLTAALFEADQEVLDDDGNVEEDEVSSVDSEMDMRDFDDDGGNLADQDGQSLVPLDPEQQYEEEQSLWTPRRLHKATYACVFLVINPSTHLIQLRMC